MQNSFIRFAQSMNINLATFNNSDELAAFWSLIGKTFPPSVNIFVS
jgi:hypothetical protein